LISGVRLGAALKANCTASGVTSATGLQLLRAGVDELRRAGFGQYLTTFLGKLAEAQAMAGDMVAGDRDY